MPRTIVGAVYVTNPGPWWVPPGLESTQGPGANPPPYRSPFFGADREYTNEDDGWQPFRTRKQRQNMRRDSRRKREDDNYGFNDTY
jgi:hypothetical protein